MADLDVTGRLQPKEKKCAVCDQLVSRDESVEANIQAGFIDRDMMDALMPLHFPTAEEYWWIAVDVRDHDIIGISYSDIVGLHKDCIERI